MHLPAIDLPSTKGARLQVTAKSFANTARQAEEQAALLRSEAAIGASHPATIVDFYRAVTADLAAIRTATEAEIGAIEQALKTLDGEATPVALHPLVATAREMRLIASTFSKSSSQLTRDKATTLIEDARLQLKAAAENADMSIAANRHRLEAIRNKCADGLRSALSRHTGQLMISLKDAAEILGLSGIPADDTRPLPAANFDPRLPGDHPARAAAVLSTVCRSKEAEIELQRQHAEAKRAKGERPKPPSEVVREELQLLPEC